MHKEEYEAMSSQDIERCFHYVYKRLSITPKHEWLYLKWLSHMLTLYNC